MLKSLVTFGSLALFALAAPAGCAAHADAPQADGAAGSVSLAITSTGPDGAKYTIGPSVYFAVSSPTNPSFGSWGLGLSADAPTQSYQVPSGSYEGFLRGGSTDGNGGTTYELVRTNADGTLTSVAATLLDADDYKFQVFDSQTTSVTFHFSVAGLGNVTFSTGTLSLGASVAQTTGTGTSATETLAGTLTQQTVGGTTAVQSILTIPNGTAVPVIVGASFTSPWAPQLDSICAGVTVHLSTSSTTPAVQTLVGELDGGTGEVCIGDPQSSSFLSVTRVGLPQTAALAGQITTSTSFFGVFYFQPPAGVWDDHTFAPGKLHPAATLSYASFQAQFTASDGTTLDSVQVDGGNASTLGINP